MKSRFSFITTLFLLHTIFVLAQSGFEQYCYWQKNKPMTIVPIVRFQNNKKWYGEARFNYEELGSFSLHVGKNFHKERGHFSYSLTPIVGGVVGKYDGLSLGLLTSAKFHDLFFSSQS